MSTVVISDFSGGRNGADAPLGPQFQPNQVVDAVNVDWYRTSGLRKRNGSTNISMTGSPWAAVVTWLGRHVPGTSEADAELWGLDESGFAGFARLDNSATWTQPVGGQVDLPVALNLTPWGVTSASLNGLFFLAWEPSVGGPDRLHCYDPTTDSIRRTGNAAPTTSPSVGNTGAGAYAATPRWYRVRYTSMTFTQTVFSEPSPASAFTPSGAGTAARVTRPAPDVLEHVTGWLLEASNDNVTFFVINSQAIATTFVDDSQNPLNYTATNYTVSPLTGRFTTQKAYKFIAADSNRLIGFGSYVATDKQARLEISAVVGSLDQGDAERVDTTSVYYYDLDEKDSGIPTALVGPLYGNFYPMKSRQVWEMAPTGQVESPYRVTAITKELGCVASHAAGVGEGPDGTPCLYFMSHRGLYRYSTDGLHYISRGIEDLILGPTSTMNMAATDSICHLVYHQDRRQLWVWFATGSSNDVDTLCVLNVITGGWARYTGSLVQARCSVMFARSIGATMGFALTPYIGSVAATNRVVRLDDTSVNQDASVSYQATVTTRPIEPAGTGFRGRVRDVTVLAPAASGVTLTVVTTPDFGAQPGKTGTVLLTAAGSETRVSRRAEDTEVGDVQFVQLTVGDGAAANNNWSVDRISMPVTDEAEPTA